MLTPTGTETPLTESLVSDIKQLKDKWSAEGKRVILLARKAVDGAGRPKTGADCEDYIMHELGSGLTLVGLLAILDPPRPEIPGVVTTLRRAGIRVFMVRLPHFALPQRTNPALRY